VLVAHPHADPHLWPHAWQTFVDNVVAQSPDDSAPFDLAPTIALSRPFELFACGGVVSTILAFLLVLVAPSAPAEDTVKNKGSALV